MAAYQITVCGLGPGSWEALPVGVLATLRQAGVIFLRTEQHPVVPRLKAMGLTFNSFDRFYEEEKSFAAVYKRIAATVISQAKLQPVVYAVPGHPLVAEEPTRLIMAGAAAEGLTVQLLPAMSFLDAVYAALSLDPAAGMVVLDGLSLDPKLVCPHLPAVVMQVYSRLVASEVKLFLMDYYSDAHPVTVIRAAGVPDEEKRADVPLYTLDRLPWLDHLTTIYLPPVKRRRPPSYSVAPLVRIMAQLRSKEGCPWDREQTHESLKKYLLEETYEVLEAIDGGNPHNLCEELGDLLLQIVFHAQIAREAGKFDFADVVRTITKKMVYRHPHVFGSKEVKDSEEVLVNWERLKKKEKPNATFGSVTRSLPALLYATRVQEKASRIGFDWDEWRGAMDKVLEEAGELKKAVAAGRGVGGEVGDLLFAVVNVARLLGIDAEDALRQSTAKFIRRMEYIEARARDKGLELKDLDLSQMDAWWEEAKRLEVEG
ncbi:tetrapyrrole methylase family protein/MazG family protein [Thermodesulfitimonas autotrophica]|uniref:Tetrapyrrole methylase family protein/MazG family protein n=1 Tax=Thermodesulfitimonas autotrophica TaxID=1894989 RepID=A0A3N5BEN8_9THEO|nr:nucleoside triphosphate pyrophosphohydrolase [Thermodesulfitimonas autotrophica]RPF42491.1 tetrapyrrole methylase family protein/MazG family protein [Thermodesulfitimonas autotrophica]